MTVSAVKNKQHIKRKSFMQTNIYLIFFLLSFLIAYTYYIFFIDLLVFTF